MNTSELQRHAELLQKLCRLCGHEIDLKYKYDKHHFNEELGDMYGMDLNFDLDHIHPVYICKRCSNVLYRVRQAKGKEEKKFTTDLIPFSFDKHTDKCKICLLSNDSEGEAKRGRPKKRKIPKPEKIIKEWKNEQDDDEIPSKAPKDNSTECKHSEVQINCKPCFSYVKKQFCTLFKNRTEDEKLTIVKEFMLELDTSDISLFAYVIGLQQRKSIKKDAQSFAMMYKDLDTVAKFKSNDWLQDRNPVVKNFCFGMCGLPSNSSTMDDNQTLIVMTTVEQSYKLCEPKLVSPFAFLQNLCIYSLTGSKQAVDIVGKTKPAGCYKTVVSWLMEQSTDAPVLPGCDVMNVFDNEQVIGNKSGIRPKNKAKISIITNKGYVAIEENLQKMKELKPPYIIRKDTEDYLNFPEFDPDVLKSTVESIIDSKSERNKSYIDAHYEQLYLFLEVAMRVVAEEQEEEEENLRDYIDRNIIEKEITESFIKCSICGTLNSKKKRICQRCNEKEGIKKARTEEKLNDNQGNERRKTKEESFTKLEFDIGIDGEVKITSTNDVKDNERYEHVQSGHKGKKELILSDPVFCNPNSFDTVARVLRQIGQENGIYQYGGNSRHWTHVCCDGVPYLICKKLKEEAVVCIYEDQEHSRCGKTFLSLQLYESHVQQEHSDTEEFNFCHEFNWFYLRIGGGHFEMNLVKGFFELNWLPFMEKLCEEMSFTSDAAKLYAKNCKDHHKSWQLLLTMHLSVLRELVLPYVRHCLLTKENYTGKGFFKYVDKSYMEIPNLRYIMDQVCRFSQGIINFRIGTRRNNAALMASAKYMTKEIFHARNHPKYQQIEMYDHIQYLIMPDEVKQQSDRFASITTSGHNSTGEDLDFVLEEKNKQLKQWISKGVPTDAVWQKICRNNTVLQTLKVNLYSLLGILPADASLRGLDIDPAIDAFRLILREKNYLWEPKDEHFSIDGHILDFDLVNLIERASAKRVYLLKTQYLNDDIDIPNMSYPIPVTPQERDKFEDINNQTKAQIAKEISYCMEMLPEGEIHDYFEVCFKKVKAGKKTEYLSFLAELRDVIRSGLAEEADELRHG